jgi:uncharacterized membrane protein
MRVQVFKTLDRIRSSFWFIPSVMAIGAMVLALAMVAVETPVTGWLMVHWGWGFTGGAEGASALLGAIAGSMITIAGVVFSMTLVALSLASSQLGPRLLRNFMRDTTTQITLGTFVATFLYCLLVLRTIRHAEASVFVPHLAVSLGVLLAVVSVGVLIYFIHHVSLSIQANQIVARIGKDLIKGLDRLYPETIGQGAPEVAGEPPTPGFLRELEQEGHPIGSKGDGYLRFIDGEELMALAIQADVVIQVQQQPGDYLVATRPLALVWSGSRFDDEWVNQINSAFVLGKQRTSSQDIEFAVNELVEIAIRALSSGVNDPFTAITCVDRLGSALCRLAPREMPSPYRYDAEGKLRIITKVLAFSDIVDAAFNQIRQSARSNAAVTIRLLEIIAEIANFVEREGDRAALLRHAEMIYRGANGGLPEAQDRDAVEKCFQAARRALSATPDSGR